MDAWLIFQSSIINDINVESQPDEVTIIGNYNNPLNTLVERIIGLNGKINIQVQENTGINALEQSQWN